LPVLLSIHDVKRDSTALPQEFAIAYGKAYAIGTDIDIKNLSDYNLNAYDKAIDLYIFNENVNFHEGLEQVFRILLEQSFKDFEPSKIEPVIDVGIPPIETLREVFDSVVKHFLHYHCLFFYQSTTSMPRNSKMRFHRSKVMLYYLK